MLSHRMQPRREIVLAQMSVSDDISTFPNSKATRKMMRVASIPSLRDMIVRRGVAGRRLDG